MKRILLVLSLLIVMCLVGINLCAQEIDSTDVIIDRQLELYGFSENNTLGDASKLTNVSIDDLRVKFKLNPRDSKLEFRTLKALRIDPENIVKFKDNSLYKYDHDFTLKEVSSLLHIPIKKLLEYLKLEIRDKANYDKTLMDLRIKPAQIETIRQEFMLNRTQFGATLTLIGMIVVFLALALTALIITQMVHFNEKKKTKPAHSSVSTPIGTISTQKVEDLSSSAIVAVITAIHMRMQELEEENKLMLTWRRANVSMWQASGKVQFPNNQFYLYKK